MSSGNETSTLLGSGNDTSRTLGFQSETIKTLDNNNDYYQSQQRWTTKLVVTNSVALDPKEIKLATILVEETVAAPYSPPFTIISIFK